VINNKNKLEVGEIPTLCRNGQSPIQL
jgi:hypothetical protein